MDKEKRKTLLKAFGWCWILAFGIPMALYLPMADPYTAHGWGMILGELTIMLPGFAALYWGGFRP